jgi:hypothetical protein
MAETEEEPTSGFMVGYPDMGIRVTRNGNHKPLIVSWAQAVLVQIERRAMQHSLPADRLIDDIAVGVWVDGDYVYYDVSLRFEHKTKARHWGEQWGEIAIWDVANAEEIRLR